MAITAPFYPAEFTRYRFDPTALISTFEDAQDLTESLLSTASIALSGQSFRSGGDPGPWNDLARAPLTCLLYAASPAAIGRGIEWALEATENVAVPKQKGPYQTLFGPELGVRGRVDWGSRVRGAGPRGAGDGSQAARLGEDDGHEGAHRVLSSRRDRATLDLNFFDDPTATLYLLTPATVPSPLRPSSWDQLINRQRTKVAQWEDFQRIGLFLDEITNTPIPRLPQYLAESRGLGCSICYAAQAGSQLDAIYGPLQGKAIRDVTPATLVMYGSHERDVMESAAFWSGKATRSQQSYDHNGDNKNTARHFGNALEPAELLPRNTGEARLIWRGTPGELVELMDWDDFVRYLDAQNLCSCIAHFGGSRRRIRGKPHQGRAGDRVLAANPVRASRRVGRGRRPSRPRFRGVCRGGR